MSIVPYTGGTGGSLPQAVPQLTGENYMAWAIKMEANLDAAGLWEAVVVPEDAAAAVIAKKDKPARAYLLGALAENLLLQVAAKKTAAEVWAALKARFVGTDRVRAARLGTLRGEFELLRMASGDTLDRNSSNDAIGKPLDMISANCWEVGTCKTRIWPRATCSRTK